jgi:predicted N-acetyltransferase YhbS
LNGSIVRQTSELMDVTISEVTQIDPELVAAFERLMPQLSDSATRLGVRDLEEIVSSPATTLLLARDLGGEIVGTVTLVVFRIPSGRRARLQSLIVDRSVRGRRVGFALCQAALETGSCLSTLRWKRGASQVP